MIHSAIHPAPMPNLAFGDLVTALEIMAHATDAESASRHVNTEQLPVRDQVSNDFTTVMVLTESFVQSPPATPAVQAQQIMLRQILVVLRSEASTEDALLKIFGTAILKMAFSHAWDNAAIQSERPWRCLKRISVNHTIDDLSFTCRST